MKFWLIYLFHCYSVFHCITILPIYLCFCWRIFRLLCFCLFALLVIALCWAEVQEFLWDGYQGIEFLSYGVWPSWVSYCQRDLKSGWYQWVLLTVMKVAFFIFRPTYNIVRCFNFLLIWWMWTGILLKHEFIVPWWLVNMTSFYILIDHLDFLLCELPVHWPCPFFNFLICLFVLICLSY